MRTKALLLTAAIGAAGIATSMAQVYSVNAVGYVNVTIPKKAAVPVTYAIVSNPLNGTNNLLSTILPNPPDGTSVYLFRAGAYEVPSFLTGVGWIGDTAVDPGEGFFVALDNATAPDPTVLTFVGEVPTGNLTNSLPANFSIRSSIVPQSGLVTSTLLLTPNDGDNLYKFDPVTQAYVIFSYLAGVGWLDTEPTIGVAEGFFYQNTTAQSIQWGRTFTVN
jgi:hypothetical protein